jgi:hypothetical protein
MQDRSKQTPNKSLGVFPKQAGLMWKPLAEDKLARMIDEAQLFMSPDCRRFWNNIKITPQKWTRSGDA